jgi:hypothetical protein
MSDKVKYHKVCSVTGEGIYEGYYAKLDDEEYYFKYSSDAIFWCVCNGYDGIDDAFDKGVIEWREWDEGGAGSINPYIQSCQEDRVYNMEIIFGDALYKVQYTKSFDDWMGITETISVSDDYGYELDEVNPEYKYIKDFVIKIKGDVE